MVGSDGFVLGDEGHPRTAGSFPRVLGRYVRQEGLLSLADALAKMTIMPAQALGLTRKGKIAPGRIWLSLILKLSLIRLTLPGSMSRRKELPQFL